MMSYFVKLLELLSSTASEQNEPISSEAPTFRESDLQSLRRITFHNKISVVLIPQAAEYHEAGKLSMLMKVSYTEKLI